MNPTYRPGAQRSDKLRAADDLGRSATNEATAVRAPIHLPCWGHIAQPRDLCRLRRDATPLDMARADRADAYERLPLAAVAELDAAVARQDLGHRLARGFFLKK